MAQLSLTWEPLWVSEIPIRVHCLLIWDRVAFTLVGVNADPILNDFVVFRVLVSVVDITQITPTEIGMHQVMLSFLVTWLFRCRVRRQVTWWVRPGLVMWPSHGHVFPKFWSHGSWHILFPEIWAHLAFLEATLTWAFISWNAYLTCHGLWDGSMSCMSCTYIIYCISLAYLPCYMGAFMSWNAYYFMPLLYLL